MGEYGPPVDQLLNQLEDPRLGREWPDYLALGFQPEHVPDLIRMATDPALNSADSGSREVWAPVHAWRTLGQLRAESAVGPLTEMMARLSDEGSDDWASGELPTVLGMIGPASIPGAAALLETGSMRDYTKTRAGRVLEEVGTRHPEARDQCIAVLSGCLENGGSNPSDVNGFLVDNLLNLRANEAAGVIERAFSNGWVDESIVGTWYDVWHELDLEGEPPPLPERRIRPDPEWSDDWPYDSPELTTEEPEDRQSWQPIEARTPEERKDRNKARKKLEAKVKGKKKKR